MVIINAFDEWWHLLGVEHMIINYIDHKNLECFMNVQVLINCHQARWNMFQVVALVS
jgi:hypothetical protein